MKILHVTDGLGSGGRERQVVECLKGLSARKDLICELVIMDRKIHYSAVNDLNIKIYFLIRKIKKDPKILIKLFKICTKFKPDIIHTWDSMASVYAVPISKILRIKLINGMIREARPKSNFFDKAWIRSKFTFPFSDVIVSNSYAGLKCYNAPSTKSLCIHNGFDFERIRNLQKKETVKARFNINTENVVGMVASFSKKKDYKTFISVAHMVLKEKENLTFLAIGDGEKLEKSKKLVQSRFKEKIKFLGKQKNIESIVNLFHVGILATDTRFHSEGISNAIMEYMALGKPVVATRDGGTTELVFDRKTGFLVNTRDEKEMYRKIKKLLDDKDLAMRMGNNGKERIFAKFSLEKMTNSFVCLYENILKEGHCDLFSFRD